MLLLLLLLFVLCFRKNKGPPRCWNQNSKANGREQFLGTYSNSRLTTSTDQPPRFGGGGGAFCQHFPWGGVLRGFG